MTLRLFTTQCRPTRTLARSPRMMQSFITIVCRRKERHELQFLPVLPVIVQTRVRSGCSSKITVLYRQFL